MPPSGFNQRAVNGLLVFVQDTYKQTLDKFKGKNISEQQVLKEMIAYIEKSVDNSSFGLKGNVTNNGISGLKAFITENFKDLIKEIEVGKKQEGQAMQAEIKDIGRYLEQFTLH